jgi:O-antigen/teichoic acid export membrane protein
LRLLRYKKKAFGALAVKSLPLLYGGAVVLFVNTRLPRETELGVYSLSIATFFVVSLLGKSFALYPLIKFLAEGNPEAGIWAAGAVNWIGSQICGALAVLALAPLAPDLFKAPGLDAGMRWAAWILLAFIPRDLASALLQSRRALSQLFVLEACYFLCVSGGLLYLFVRGSLHHADQVLGLNLAGAVLSTAAAPLLCWKILPAWSQPSVEVRRKALRYGRDSLGIGVGDLVYTQLDYHLLGLFLGAPEVALYFAAKMFFRFYNAVTQAINLLVFPTSSDLFARGELTKLRELVEKVLGGYLGLLVLINLVVWIGADWIVALVYRGLYPDAADILRIFALASFFEPLYMVSENVLYGIGKPRAVLIAMWSSIVLFLALAVVLMPIFGAVGGALTVLSTLISLAGITLYFLNREINVNLWSILRRGGALIRNRP